MKYPYRLLVAAVALFIFCPTSLFAQEDEYGPQPGEKPDTIWFNLNEPAQQHSKPVRDPADRRGQDEPVAVIPCG
ncbi:MAG TPA: hypothetical protein VHW43_13320 [Puia sp.]|nr:hypothetical protein [Puia sp.]